MLSEAEVQRSFRKLFNDPQFAQDSLERGEQLIEKLRPESPLRIRLADELEQLREVYSTRS